MGCSSRSGATGSISPAIFATFLDGWPLFTGVAQRRLSFRLSIPLAGTYYVILDNRKGAEAREVRVLIEATRRARPPQKRQPAPAPGLDAT